MSASPTSKIKISFASLCLAIFVAQLFSAQVQAQTAWQWGKTATGLAEGWALATDRAGNIFCAGYDPYHLPVAIDTFTFPSPGPLTSAYWVKYNASGAAQWAGSTSLSNAYISNMATDATGNLVILGYFTGDSVRIDTTLLINTHGAGVDQYFLAKLSPSGSVLWAVNDGNYTNGDIFVLAILAYGSVATDDTGNIYITGEYRTPTTSIGTYTFTNATPSGLKSDIFLAKYTPTGTLAWATSAGGTDNDHVWGLTLDPTNNIYITGEFWSPSLTFGPSVLTDPYPSKPRAYIAKYSSAGVPLWAQAAGGSRGAGGVGIASDDTGNIYISGIFADTSITFGSTTLTRPYPAAVPLLANYLVKYSPAGTVTWGRTQASATSAVTAFSLAWSHCGKIWVSGNCRGDLVLQPADTLSISFASAEAFIAGYDPGGNVVGSSSLNNTDDDQHEIACDGAGNVYMCSDFETSITIGPDAFTTANEQYFMARYGSAAPDTGYTHQYASICELGTASLVAPSAGYYVWDDGETTQVRTVTTPGTYWVFATACGDTVTADTFHVLDHVPIISGPDSLPFGGTSLFSDTVGGGTWYSSPASIGTIDSVTGVYTDSYPGVVTITYTIGGCSVTKQVKFLVWGGVPLVGNIVPTLISPNPATDYLTIQIPPDAYNTGTLINNLGQVVMTQPIVTTQTRVDVSELPAGIYYLRLTGEGDTRVVQVVKE